jgi:hypothetical protein
MTIEMIQHAAIDLQSLLLGAFAALAVIGLRALWKRRQAARATSDSQGGRGSMDPAVVAAILAAITAEEAQPVRIHRVRYLDPHFSGGEWMEISRAQQLMSRQPGKKG